jgi:pyruvate kinase
MPTVELPKLLKKVRELHALALATEKKQAKSLQKVHPLYQASARNLMHYMAIRSVDLRQVQEQLSALAISSLTHSEAYTLENLERIEELILALMGERKKNQKISRTGGNANGSLLQQNTARLFGKTNHPGHTRLMVTMPSEAAEDESLIHALVRDGMQIARINTAHDDVEAWKKMISNIRKASHRAGKKIRIYMDLAGPKIRTGEILLNPIAKKASKVGCYLPAGSRILFVAPRTKRSAYASQPYPVMSVGLSAVFPFVRSGDPISMDDGKFSGKVLACNAHSMLVEILRAPLKDPLLAPEKGMNFPETHLDIPALSAEDLRHLPFIVKYADMIGFSFVQNTQDISGLEKRLKKLGGTMPGLILKIENRKAFENLPRLMLAAMRMPKVGIMIARGDLAVELGFMRIAEVQEEILWLAEAAHLPAIWATEILDSLVKKGKLTRAEISDAVKTVRAECAMLNKGPFISEGLKLLRDIDIRMSAHEQKKMKTLRSLHIAFQFLQD